MKQVIELGDTTTADVRGSSDTTYRLQATKWLKQINDAAKKRHMFAQAVYTSTLGKGQNSLVVPYKTAYLSSVTDNTTEGGAITFTDLNNLDGVRLNPEDHGYGISISNKAVRDSIVDIVREARAELTYYAGDVVDKAVANAMRDATAATSSARGVSIVYGGSSNYEEDDLASGDTLTPADIIKAKRKLRSATQTYTDFSSAFGTSSQSKNPWAPPFTMWIGPEQEEALLNDSQFRNAAEFGSGKIVLNGQIARYMGVNIVVADNTPSYSSGDSCTDGGSGTWAADGHRCIMAKSEAAAALVWDKEPSLQVSYYPRELSTDVMLELDYATDSIHDDAICWVSVTDE